ncbi:MAG: hypothetical protein GF313_14830 [Caldithrix sp.]|nr:hypothetical protein [Caldithrix sp.]
MINFAAIQYVFIILLFLLSTGITQNITIFTHKQLMDLPEIGYVNPWSRGSLNNYFMCKDINRDGHHEIILNEGDVYITDSDIKIFTQDQHYIDVEGIDYELLSMTTVDSDGDSLPELITAGKTNYQLYLYHYILKNNKIGLKQSKLIFKGREVRDAKDWDLDYLVFYAIPNKPQKLLMAVRTGFDLSPRGLYQIDLPSLHTDWELQMGTAPAYLDFVDSDGDQEYEILLSTYSPDNNYTHNGLSDSLSYLLHISPDGQIMDQRIMNGRLGTTVLKKIYPAAAQPQFYILSGSNAVDSTSSTYIQILDYNTLDIVQDTKKNNHLTDFGAATGLNSFQIKGYEIPLIKRGHRVLRLNSSYQIENEYYFKNLNKEIFMADLNADNQPEFLFINALKPHLVITDQNMRLLGKQNFILNYYPNIEIVQRKDIRQTTIYFEYNNNFQEWNIPFEHLNPPSHLTVFIQRHRDTIITSSISVIVVMALILLSLQIAAKSNKLRISNRLYYYFMQNQTKGILIIDADKMIVDANDYFCKLFDTDKYYIHKLSIDKSNTILNTPHFKEKIHELLDTLDQELEVRLSVNHQLKRFLVSASQIETIKNKTFYIIEWTDLSQITASDRLAAWSSMSQRLAHEIKNPLTTILLSLRQVQKRLANQFEIQDTQIDEYIQSASEEIERLRNSTNTFMKFTDAAKENVSQINVNGFILDILKTYKHNYHIRFATEFQPDLPPLNFDSQQFRQIFLQLLDNSIDAIQTEGEITIRTHLFEKIQAESRNIDEYIQMEIIDNGQGIEDHHLESIFEPNFTTKSTGSGFGLSITKFLLEQKGGEIFVESKYGYGTSFTLNFPINAGFVS